MGKDKLKEYIEELLCGSCEDGRSKVCSFEELVGALRDVYKSTMVEYQHYTRRVKSKIRQSLDLGYKEKDRKMCYGVYIIYCLHETQENNSCENIFKGRSKEVLYIGKGGTLNGSGIYETQDSIKRIFEATKRISKDSIERVEKRFGKKLMYCNEGKNIRPNKWFKCLCEVCKLIYPDNTKPKLCIEIICIDNNTEPQCKLLAPSVIENILLACYLYSEGKLPLFNGEL